jgi:hypothetical protein
MRALLFVLLIINSRISFSQNCDFICNGSFEAPIVLSNPGLYPASAINCWQTTAPDGIIEIWSNGFLGVNAYHGNQLLELNANFVSTVYQDFSVAPGSNLEIKFAHRGRAGIDTMSVSFGPVGGPYTLLGIYADSLAWGYYTINTIVPNSGTYYSLRFNSISAALNLPTVGNLLDAVSVCVSNTGFEFPESAVQPAYIQNPFDQFLSVYIKCLKEVPLTLTLLNMNGEEIISDVYLLQNGINKIQINTANIPNGIYLLKAKTDADHFFKKVIRQF